MNYKLHHGDNHLRARNNLLGQLVGNGSFF